MRIFRIEPCLANRSPIASPFNCILTAVGRCPSVPLAPLRSVDTRSPTTCAPISRCIKGVPNLAAGQRDPFGLPEGLHGNFKLPPVDLVYPQHFLAEETLQPLTIVRASHLTMSPSTGHVALLSREQLKRTSRREDGLK